MSQDELDMSPLCPRCGVSTVTPSKAQTWAEGLARMFFVGHYRCHTCLKRFAWFMSPLLRIREREPEHVRAHRVGAGG